MHQQPAVVVRDQIVAAPTLVRRMPAPLRRLVGDLSDAARVRLALDLGPPERSTSPRQVSEDMSTSPVPRSRPAALVPRPPGEASTQTAKLAELRAQLREAQETIEAIRGGGVDSLMIGPPGQEQVYSLASADRTYRLVVEAMNEGAATVSPRGVILDANPRLSPDDRPQRLRTGRHRGARPDP